MNQREQRAWDEFERTYRAEAEAMVRSLPPDAEPHQRPDHSDKLPTTVIVGASAVVIGVWTSVVLLAVGAFVSAAAVGLASLLLCRGWSPLRGLDQKPRRTDAE